MSLSRYLQGMESLSSSFMPFIKAAKGLTTIVMDLLSVRNGNGRKRAGHKQPLRRLGRIRLLLDWPHCSAHSSKIDRMFDSEPRRIVLTIETVTLAHVQTCSHVTNCQTNSHGNGRPVTGPIATAII